MERTKNYNLLKPGADDFYDVDDFNKNADIIDEELKEVDRKVDNAVEKIQAHKKDITTLQDNQYVHPTYASRPSGLYKTTIDSTGHVSATAAVTANDLPLASTSQKGVVQLDDNIASTAIDRAATSGAVKQAIERVEGSINGHANNTDGHNGWAGKWVDIPNNFLTDMNNLKESGVYRTTLQTATQNEPYNGGQYRCILIFVRCEGDLLIQEIYYAHGYN